MKIEEVYKIWLREYKDFVKDHISYIILYNRTKKQLEDAKAQIDKFHVEAATTVRIRLDGVFKTVAKMQRSGKTVFFEDENDIPSELGKRIFLLSFKELVSRKGNQYVLCDSWTDEDPLEELRSKEGSLKAEIGKITSVYNKTVEGLATRKTFWKTIKLLKKFDEKTGNWNILVVASKYLPILDNIKDKFTILTVYDIETTIKFHVLFKEEKKSYIYEFDKEFDFCNDENDQNLFKMEKTPSGFVIKFYTMMKARETTQADLEQEMSYANKIIYDHVSKEKLVEKIQQKL